VSRPRSTTRIRLTGFAQAAVGATVGLLAYRFWSRNMGLVALGGAAIVFLAALLSPHGAFLFIEKMVARLGRLVGLVLTWILLTTIYLLVFTPMALYRRLRGQDAMARALDPKATSYWQAHAAWKPGLDRYKSQF
jgi:hypothetical protein